MNRGVVYALGAYGAWGIIPIFWKQLDHVPAIELLGHRMVWSLLILMVVLAVRNRWRWVDALRRPRTLITSLVTATLIGSNWLIFIWAVNSDHLVEVSLGYFINPLVSVLLGVLFLGERLRGWQWAAVGLAAAGVLYLTLNLGALPWIALTLAGSFALYGLLRKTHTVGSLEALSLEMVILFLPALGYLVYLGDSGAGSFGADLTTSSLLAATGIITTIPLLLFGGAARRIPLFLIGIFQYIAPTLQFLLGVFVYGEPFTRTQLEGYALIWLALLLFAVEGISHARRNPRLVPAGL